VQETLELKLGLLVCFLLSAVYVVYALTAEADGGHPFGHWLGIFGTLLMLATETLYSLRKRTGLLRQAGPVRHWLSAHIFTGIVGPFLVLLHSAFDFRGLAGFTLALTVLITLSGFLGRYFYTAIPHTLAGVETSTGDLAAEMNRIMERLSAAARPGSAAVQALVEAELRGGQSHRSAWSVVLLRAWDDWRYTRGLRHRIAALQRKEPQNLGNLESLLRQRYRLERQLRTVKSARRLLSLWHVAHVPMGFVLFSSVAVHVAATLYFGAGR
jgi:hypothetical protein